MTAVRRTVVLLHAFPLSAQMWTEQSARLAERGCQVLTPDQRGFGAIPLGDDPPSLDVVADDVARLLDADALDQVVLGGISMGGYVAMAMLRRHADRVCALILMDTKASADAPPAVENRERIARTILAERTPRVLVDDVLPGLVGKTTRRERPQALARIRSLAEEASPESVAWAQRAMAARPDSTDTLRGTTVPALVLVGEEDELSTVEDAQAMADALPRSRLVTVPRAGHLTPLETPAEVNAELTEFLVGLDASRI